MFQKATPGLVSGLAKFNTYSNSFDRWSSAVPYFFMMMSFAGKCPLHSHLDTRKWVIIINKTKWWWNNLISLLYQPNPRNASPPGHFLHILPASGLTPCTGGNSCHPAGGSLVTSGRCQCPHPSSVPWPRLWAHSHHTEVAEVSLSCPGWWCLLCFF